MPKIAIIGDIHFQFTATDVAYFNRSDYDLLLFVGDLGEFDPREDLKVAARLAQVTTPAVFIPGNHDVANYFNVVAEALDWSWLELLSGLRRHHNVTQLANTLDPVTCGGYSCHSFNMDGLKFDVVVGRPFSMGGPRVSFPKLIKRLHGISTLDESTAKLKACVDQSQSDNLIFLAHNGPTGCGDLPTDPWGKDFGRPGGDFGEPDLAAAVEYAGSVGKRVVAVVAGHMHHMTQQGLERTWHLVKEETHIINAACVPRVFVKDGQQVRHHICLTFTDAEITCAEMFVAD